MRIVQTLSLALMGTLSASAGVIVSFTATPSPGTPFTETINSSVSGSTASITNSVISCVSTSVCSGAAADFMGTVTGVSTVTPLSITIDGILSGTTPAGGVISLTSPFAINIPFSVSPGTFSTSIASTNLAGSPTGSFNVAGTVDFTLAPTQTLTLPSSLSFSFGAAPTAAPEPGTWLLLGVSLAVLGAMRYRRGKAVC